MKVNKVLKGQFIEIVENQLKANNPPETKQTYQRLLDLGINASEAKMYIGQCVAFEIFHVMKNQEVFNEKRFIGNLNKLPGKLDD